MFALSRYNSYPIPVARFSKLILYLKVSSIAHTAFVPPNFTYDFSSPTSLTDSGSTPFKYWPVSPFLVRYALAKGANILFATELQRRLNNEEVNIISLSVHPGGVRTPGNAKVFWGVAMPLVHLVFDSPDQGAVTLLFAAAAREVGEKKAMYGGQFLAPYGKVGTPHRDMKNEKIALDLWNTTRTLVDRYLASNGLDPLSI